MCCSSYLNYLVRWEVSFHGAAILLDAASRIYSVQNAEFLCSSSNVLFLNSLYHERMKEKKQWLLFPSKFASVHWIRPYQSGLGSDHNEEMLYIPQSSSITGTTSSDYLVSYPRHSLVESYPSADVELVCSTALANWAIDIYVYRGFCI